MRKKNTVTNIQVKLPAETKRMTTKTLRVIALKKGFKPLGPASMMAQMNRMALPSEPL